MRQSTLVFGVSVYAYAAVLAAFMGGTALGSYLLGRRADKVANPLRLYAGLQLGIAITGFVSSLALTSKFMVASMARKHNVTKEM